MDSPDGVLTHSQPQNGAGVRTLRTSVGPVFSSRTKEFAEFAGLGLLREVAAEISLPMFAIGGINQQNLADVLATGVERVAVSNAIWQAADPASEVPLWRGRLMQAPSCAK